MGVGVEVGAGPAVKGGCLCLCVTGAVQGEGCTRQRAAAGTANKGWRCVYVSCASACRLHTPTSWNPSLAKLDKLTGTPWWVAATCSVPDGPQRPVLAALVAWLPACHCWAGRH